MNKYKSNAELEFKFTNPNTKKEEEYIYYLDADDVVTAFRAYADKYLVILDGTDTAVFNLFMSLDPGRYEYINEVLDKVIEDDYVKNYLLEDQSIVEKAQEEFLKEKEEELEAE